jgi:hypothetical protein
VTFSFTQSSVTSDTQPQFRYATRNLPKGSGIYLQAQDGSSAWAYVQTLHAFAGTADVPALPPGIFAFRIRILHGPAVVAISPAQRIAVTPAHGGSGCGICSILGGVGGAIANFIIDHWSWLIGKLPLP